jgi:hypothetical protein
MRRALLAIALLAAFPSVGCSTWVHSGKNRQEWYGDFRACNEDATLIADYANGYVKGGIGIEFRLYPKVRPTLFRPFGKRIRENCMQDRGWTRDETPDEAPAAN